MDEGSSRKYVVGRVLGGFAKGLQERNDRMLPMNFLLDKVNIVGILKRLFAALKSFPISS